jgi:hypothetical protein
VTGLPQEFEEWQPNLTIATAIADLTPPVFAKASLKRGKPAASITSKIDLAVVQWQLRRILAWFATREEAVRLGRLQSFMKSSRAKG